VKFSAVVDKSNDFFEAMSERLAFGKSSDFANNESEYLKELPIDDDLDIPSNGDFVSYGKKFQINGSKELLESTLVNENGSDDENRYREQFGSGLVNTRISDRENEVKFFSFFFFSSI
jgi:hypothetical protein